jgi:RNA polymerase sigma-70 factor (ECF subfamily)
MLAAMAGDKGPNLTQTVTSTFLLEGLREAGNDTVWAQFVERYRPLIVRYAQRLGLSETDAQDAAQQALIAFCTSYRDGKYQREQGRLRVWLFGIARNQIFNTRKRARRREVLVSDDTSQTNFFDRQEQDDQFEAIWEEEWQQSLLRQCLEEIRKDFDEKSLEAFELFAWKGWPAQKVADHLGMTPNAVFLVKHRVMKRIRELLPQMEEAF